MRIQLGRDGHSGGEAVEGQGAREGRHSESVAWMSETEGLELLVTVTVAEPGMRDNPPSAVDKFQFFSAAAPNQIKMCLSTML